VLAGAFWKPWPSRSQENWKSAAMAPVEPGQAGNDRGGFGSVAGSVRRVCWAIRPRSSRLALPPSTANEGEQQGQVQQLP